MLQGFAQTRIDTGDAVINVRYAGDGPPVLLLHGIPETHLMWHRVAPLLARDFTVVVTDLRGYGDSSKPPSTPNHEAYSKRAMARDQLEVMRQLGFDHFFLAGHDRGARCAYRLALDHPAAVLKLAVLDIVPTVDAFDRMDSSLARAFWLWLFLAQPTDFPERVLGANARLFLDHMLNSWSGNADVFPREMRAEYERTFRDPSTIHAICEEYRASSTLDYMLDRMRWVVEGLVVRPERMRLNLEQSRGLMHSQTVLTALLAKGSLQREDAYALVQRNASVAWDEGRPLLELLKSDPEVIQVLDPAEIEACFDPSRYVERAQIVIERLEEY
jgi:haloacetate dehalogenase